MHAHTYYLNRHTMNLHTPLKHMLHTLTHHTTMSLTHIHTTQHSQPSECQGGPGALPEPQAS